MANLSDFKVVRIVELFAFFVRQDVELVAGCKLRLGDADRAGDGIQAKREVRAGTLEKLWSSFWAD